MYLAAFIQKTNKNKILNGDVFMSRFLEWFYERETANLVNRINGYAERNNLKIISLNTTDSLLGAIVLFEGEKPKYRW